MFLESGRAIAEKIRTLIDEEVAEPIRLAVAFWGSGADFQLKGRCKIICDLESGACNPAVIRELLNRANCVVLKLSGLHAKVVIGSVGAVVSSANMSTNGLGAEGADVSGTIEAGYFVSGKLPDHKKIAAWFEEVWEKATDITELDLANAQKKWDFRNREMLVTPLIELNPATDFYQVDPSHLLEEQIDPEDRLRAVKPVVFNHLKGLLPNIDHRRQGKIATWACHLLLNRAGIALEHSAGKDERRGPATDQWIMSRFGKQKKNDTVVYVKTILEGISRDPFFSRDIRRAAGQVISSEPWNGNNDPGE